MQNYLIFHLFSLSCFFHSSHLWAEEPLSHGGVLLYNSQPDHLWNVAQNSIFKYTGDYHPNNLSPNFFVEKKKALTVLLNSDQTNKAIILLDKLISEKDTIQSQSPVARVIMQRNAWELFDWLAINAKPEADHHRALRVRVARFIQLLSLSDEEIESLPHNYTTTLLNPNEKSLEVNNLELPEELFAPESEWIHLSYKNQGRIAVSHESFHEGRSEFLLFLKIPDSRKAGLRFVEQFNQYAEVDAKRYLVRTGIMHHPNLPDIAPPEIPKGTQAVLLQRYLTISESGIPTATPLIGTIEMIESTAFHDKKTREFHQRKFAVFNVLIPNLINKKQITLKKVNEGVPTIGAEFLPSGLKQCIMCHNQGGNRLLSFSGGGFSHHIDRPYNRSLTIMKNGTSLTTANWKSRHYEYGLLKGILESFVEQNIDE